jgi:hypothetical protein
MPRDLVMTWKTFPTREKNGIPLGNKRQKQDLKTESDAADLT